MEYGVPRRWPFSCNGSAASTNTVAWPFPCANALSSDSRIRLTGVPEVSRSTTTKNCSTPASDPIGEIDDLIANHRPDETGGLQFCRQIGCTCSVAVAVRLASEGDQKSRFRRKLHQRLGGALRRFAPHFMTASLANHPADFGEQQPQIIVGFGRRADGGAAGAAGCFVRYGHRRREAVDLLRRRTFQSLQKLPRVGRKCFDVTPLTLGIKRVQRQARLAAAAQPAKHDQLAVRNVEIDALEVVHLDATQRNKALAHRRYSHLASRHNAPNCYHIPVFAGKPA